MDVPPTQIGALLVRAINAKDLKRFVKVFLKAFLEIYLSHTDLETCLKKKSKTESK